MNLTRLAVHRPVGVTMCVFAFLLLSVIALQQVGLDLLPDLEFPAAAIVVVYPGADPQTVESTITVPIEDAVSRVSGVRRVRSTSMENASVVVVEFAWGADVDTALRDLDTNLAITGSLLPAEATAPIVVRTDPSRLPLMLLAVTGGADPVELTRRVEEHVLPRLEHLPGVASVEVLGGAYEEVSVRYHSDALQQYGVTPAALYQILRLQNTVVPAGAIVDGDTRWNVRAGRRIESIEDLKNQPVARREPSEPTGLGIFALGQTLPVQLREVADVSVEQAPRPGVTRVNGSDAVLLRILKTSGANTVAAAEQVRREVSAIERSGEAGLAFRVITDQSELIRASLQNVANSALIGAVLAVLVLFLFLRSLVSILVIAVAIPLALAGAVAVLHFMGITLNLMSLGGLAIAVGMLVDNSIVVLENMSRHRQSGKSARDAAADGGTEIGAAIFASTLTTVVVFVPLLYLQGLTGQLFRDMGLAVSAALIISLLVALTIVPAAYAHWDRRRAISQGRSEVKGATPFPVAAEILAEAAVARLEPERPDFRNQSAPPGFARGIQGVYTRALRRWLARRWLGPVAAALMVVSLAMLPLGHPWTFLPEMDGGLISISLSLPPGTPVTETVRAVAAYERAIEAIPGVETVLAVAGDQGSEALISYYSALPAHRAELYVVLTPSSQRSRSAKEIAREIAGLRLWDDTAVAVQSDRVAAALGDDYFPGVTIHVTGSDLALLKETAEALRMRLQSIPGFGNISISMEEPQPELFFNVTDRSFQGVLSGGDPLTAGQVGLALRNHMTGLVATHIMHGGARLPVVLRPAEQEIESPDALVEFRVPGAALGNNGARPILGRIANLEESLGPVSIERSDRQRLVTVKAELAGIGLAKARALAESALKDAAIPPGVSAQIAGLHRVIDETRNQMIGAILVGVALVYAVMGIQFESWKQPLILMLTVPLALVGAIAALRLSGLPFSAPAAIGMLVLVGVSVNNGIVMIDCINQLRRAGLAPFDAVIQGSVVRLRPVLMTALTTLLGLIPLALGTGQGSEFQVPLALVLIGGLTTSTLLTLFVVPSIVLAASGGRSLKPVAAALALAALGLPVFQGHGEAAGVRWSFDGLAGAIAMDGGTPVLVAGAAAHADAGDAQLSVSAAGGPAANAPVVVGLQGERRLVSAYGSAAYSVSADVWLRPLRAYESRFSAWWSDDALRGRIDLARTAGERVVNPWSGRVDTSGEQRWEASVRIEDAPGRPITWERSLSVWGTVSDHPRWLLVNGASAQAEGLISARARAGLLLEHGTYYPVLRMDASVTLLPQGEIEVTLGPHFEQAPPDWPVFGAGYRGRLGAFIVALRAELGASGSGFDRRGYVNVQPAGSAYSLRLAWTESTGRPVLSLNLIAAL